MCITSFLSATSGGLLRARNDRGGHALRAGVPHDRDVALHQPGIPRHVVEGTHGAVILVLHACALFRLVDDQIRVLCLLKRSKVDC